MLNVILQEGKHSKANKSKSNSTHSYETKIENTESALLDTNTQPRQVNNS